jgi:hypothetical protein
MARRRDEREVSSMPPYVIDVARRRVIYTPSAVPTAASIAAIKQQLSQEPTLRRDFAVVFDLRELRALELTTAEMHQLIWEWPIAQDGRRALVVSLPAWCSLVSPLGTRLHVLYELLREEFAQVQVFWRLEAAHRWLDDDPRHESGRADWCGPRRR